MFRSLNAEMMNSLGILEMEALRYIDKNKKLVISYTIQDLSANTFISTATIMRLCKKLGFSGYSELKYYLREQIKYEEEERKKINTFHDIVNKGLMEIKETSKLLDEEKVYKVVDLLISKKNIHLFAKGLTYCSFSYTSKFLFTCNRFNILYQDTHIAYLSAESMTEDDVLFVASLNGNTHQVVRMAQIAKSRKATVVTFTGINANELAQIGDINFSVFVEDNNKYTSDTKTRVPLDFTLNVIISCYLEKLKSIE